MITVVITTVGTPEMDDDIKLFFARNLLTERFAITRVGRHSDYARSSAAFTRIVPYAHAQYLSYS